MPVKMQFKFAFVLPQEPRKVKVAVGVWNISSATDVVPTEHAGVKNDV